jgi:hypothetical protein
MPLRPLPATRRHRISFRQAPIRCVECGQAVDTMAAWLAQPCPVWETEARSSLLHERPIAKRRTEAS